MTKIIVCANQKGGVGKTTTAGAMIAGLSQKGYRTLGIDSDPQGNLSYSCGADQFKKPTIYELMKNEATLNDVLQHMSSFDIIPSNIMLAGAEQELSQTGKEHRLKESVLPIAENYDYIIIDTPPSLGVLTVNAFTFANGIIIPTTADVYAANGIQQLNNTINNVKKYCNSNVKIEGILFTKFEPRTIISKQIKKLTEELGNYINAPVYKTYIRKSVAITEAQANQIDIFTYSVNSTVAEDYNNFIDEYLKGEK